MYICKFCNEQFETSIALANHVKNCKLRDNKSVNKQTYSIVCKNCGKEFSLELTEYAYLEGKHRKYCSRSCANRRKHSDITKQKIKTTIGVRLNENPSLFKKYKTYTCKNCGKSFKISDNRNTSSRIYCSDECKKEWLSVNWKIKVGGYRQGAGKGKSGWYKGIFCDSSWELAFVVYHLDNNLYIERCKEYRKYLFKEKEFTYIPDFITDKGIIEIKGYRSEQWEAKEKHNPDILVLYEEQMHFYLDYVKSKYGNDFIKLYNKSEKDSIRSQKYIWLSNLTTKQHTTIKPELLDEYLNSGWVRGRIRFSK